MKLRPHLLTVFLAMGIAASVQAQTFNERMSDWPMELTVRGTIMAHGGGELPEDVVETFGSLAKRSKVENGQLVVLNLDSSKDESAYTELWEDQTLAVFNVARDVNPKEMAGEVADALNKASGIWIDATKPLSKEQRTLVFQLKDHVKKCVSQRGVMFASKPVVSMLGETEIMGGQLLGDSRIATTKVGANLFLDSVLVVNYTGKDDRARMVGVLGSHPRSVGIGIERDTVLTLSGRKMWVDGLGSATLMVMANERKPMRVRTIKARGGRRNPMEFMVDLTAWRRVAIDRTLEQFPALEPETPNVKNGTLIIVGGGGSPRGLTEEMVKMAGGEKAHMVYIPCSESEEQPDGSRMLNTWKRLGVASATMLHTKDRNVANSDEEFLAPLRKATGIFFGGGRQWNFSDSYYGTETHRLMKEVLKRGGVIGGSSAGASIQGRYLARATPVGNTEIMAPGYERGGLGFLSGVAIDQHFSQRRRQPNMTELIKTYPQLLGIGLDEATAIIVRESEAKVVGRGRVFFYDSNRPASQDGEDFVALPAGGKYDLAKREIIEGSRDEDDSDDDPSK